MKLYVLSKKKKICKIFLLRTNCKISFLGKNKNFLFRKRSELKKKIQEKDLNFILSFSWIIFFIS